MKKVFDLGGKEIALEINGATPIYYNRLFHRNVFETMAKAETDPKVTAEIVPEIAYVMAMQAVGKQKEMTEDSYLEWIEQFTLFDLVGAANSTAIVEFFMAASNSTVEAKKKEP